MGDVVLVLGELLVPGVEVGNKFRVTGVAVGVVGCVVEGVEDGECLF